MMRKTTGALTLLVLAIAGAAAAQAPCDVYVDQFENTTRSDGRICPGDTLRYQVCVKSNSASSPDLLWENSIPRSCFSSVSWFIPPAGSDTSCTRQPTIIRDGNACAQTFNVAPGGTKCGVFDAILNGGLPDGIDCTINMSVRWDTSSCTGSDTRTVDCPDPGTPDVRLTKVIEGADPTLNPDCSVSQVNEGQTITFRVEARNLSADGDDTGVVVSDDVPTGLGNFTLIEPACTPCQAGCAACFDPSQGPNGRLTVNFGNLAAQATRTIRFAMDVTPTCGTGTWSLANQATVTSDWILINDPAGRRVSDNLDGDGIPDEATCSGPITRSGTAAAAVSKSVNRTSAAPGDTLRYTITFDATAGTCTVTGTLRDDLPAGLNLVAASVLHPPSWTVTVQGPPAGANMAGFISVDAATIDGGSAPTVEFDAVVDNAGGCFQPQANVASYALSTGSGTATAPRVSITNPIPDAIQVTKVVDKAVATTNDVLTYTITVENQSACPIVAGVLHDVVPAGLVLDGASISSSLVGPVNNSTATAVHFDNIDLDVTAPGNVLIVTYQARVDGSVGGDLTNTANVTFPTTSGSDGATVRIDLPVNCPVPPEPVTGVRAVKANAGADVALDWSSTANAATYNVFKVVNGDESLVPLANKGSSQSNPDVVALAGCQGVPDASRVCNDPAAVTTNPPALLFYQVRGVCSDGVTEGDTHPF